MRAEREILSRRVFPELARVCRLRGIEFTEVDLRGGTLRTTAQHVKLLRLSLDELRRNRPYVIGLVGSRYGYIPPSRGSQEELAGLLADEPGVADMLAAGRSFLDIEFECGVIARAEMRDRAFFYFLDHDRPTDTAEAPEPGESAMLEALKGSLRSNGLRLRESIPDAETFAGWVRDDLLGVINRLVPEGAVLSAFELERRAHETFAASRRQAYVPNTALLARLDSFVESDSAPLVIHGESGSGKSALVAYWSAEYRRHHPDAFMVTHYVGAASSAGTSQELLRRLMVEIRERSGGAEEVPVAREELVEALPFWLARAAALGLILIVDGANQLEEGAAELEWLPEHIPFGLRLIVTTTSLGSRAAEHGWPSLRLEPLSVNERLAISTNYLAERNAAIAPEHVMSVAADAASSNPLFLRTRLEELRLFGAHERRGHNVEGYLAAEGLDDLFERVLERLEGEYGRTPLDRMLRSIWGARFGLSEQELERVIGCARLELAELLAALDYHLLRSDGRLRFYHDALRRAVERRYLRDKRSRRTLHESLAQFFEGEAPGSRRAEELLWQLQQAGDFKGLIDRAAGIDVLLPLVKEEKGYELLGYWLAAGAGSEIADACRRAVERYEAAQPQAIALADALNAVGDFLRLCGFFDDALPLLTRCASIRIELLGEDHPDTAQAFADLANLYQSTGDLEQAETWFRRALAVQETVLGPENLIVAKTIGSLGGVLGVAGDFDGAEALYRKALRLAERFSGPGNPYLAEAINNLAGVLHDKGKYDESEMLYRRALQMWESVYGAEHPNTAIVMNNLAALLYDKRNSTAAEELFDKVLKVFERTLGRNHPMVANVLCNWAGLIAKVSHDRALPLMQRGLEIHERSHTEANSTTAIMVYSLARIHYYAGDLDEAERYLRRAYDLQCSLLGMGHPDAAITMSGLAMVYRDRNEFWVSERLFRRAIQMLERALGPEHPQVGIQFMNLATLASRRGDIPAARGFAQRAHDVFIQADEGAGKLTEAREMLRSLDEQIAAAAV